MMLLIKEQQKSHENAKICYICKETFENKYVKDKKYCKNRNHCHYTRKYRAAGHSIYNLKYSVLKKIPLVFHNGSNNGYHFIIMVLAEGFKEQVTCLWENIEKKPFTVQVGKEVTRIEKMEKKLQKIYPTDYNLLTTQDLWKDYQFLLFFTIFWFYI